MFTNETFQNALIDDVLVARVLCSLALFYSKTLCGKLCVSVGGFAIVPNTHNSAKYSGAIFLLSFLRVGHLNFMRILARCDCRRWFSIRSKWLRGRVCRVDRGGRGVLVRGLERSRGTVRCPWRLSVLQCLQLTPLSEARRIIPTLRSRRVRSPGLYVLITYLPRKYNKLTSTFIFDAHTSTYIYQITTLKTYSYVQFIIAIP